MWYSISAKCVISHTGPIVNVMILRQKDKMYMRIVWVAVFMPRKMNDTFLLTDNSRIFIFFPLKNILNHDGMNMQWNSKCDDGANICRHTTPVLFKWLSLAADSYLSVRLCNETMLLRILQPFCCELSLAVGQTKYIVEEMKKRENENVD